MLDCFDFLSRIFPRAEKDHDNHGQYAYLETNIWAPKFSNVGVKELQIDRHIWCLMRSMCADMWLPHSLDITSLIKII